MSNPLSSAGRWRSALLLISTALLAGCAVPDEEVGLSTGRLSPCTAQGSIFETLPFAQWAATYHAKVGNVVNAHIDALRAMPSAKLRCTSTDALSLLPPTPALAIIAGTLPPWQDPERLATLSEMDIGAVLLEFLRIYECANAERAAQLGLKIAAGEEAFGAAASPSAQGTDLGTYVTKQAEQRAIMVTELAVSRLALERTLSILGGMDTLRPLNAEAECLKRLSLDMRNSLGLIADASQCLPKAVGKTSLRDPPAP